MRFVRTLTLLFILISATLVFCVQNSNSPSQNGEFRIDLGSIINSTRGDIFDDTGYRIAVKRVERIVSLAPSNTEILFAIGAGEQVIGVTDYCNYPPEVVELKNAGKLTSVGGFSTVNIERVLALKPDLVVASYGNGLETIETMRSLGLNVIAFDPKNVTDVMRMILILGRVTGHYNESLKLVKDMAAKLEYVAKKVKGERRVRVAHVLWHDPIWVSGKNTFIDEVIKIAGGENVFEFDGWRIVSIEDLISANPEVILVNSGTGMGGVGRNVIYEWLMNDERLRSIDAVKNGRVFVVNADIVSRPSYRLAEAAEIIAKLLHPDAFS